MKKLGSDLGTDTFRIYLEDGDAVHPQQPVPLSQLQDLIGYEYQNYEKTQVAPYYVYVGYKNASGAWYIKRRTVVGNVRLEASGSSNYVTNWTNRATLPYA